MKCKFLLSFFVALSFNAVAGLTPSQSKDQFCADRSESSFNKTLLQNELNMMGFANEGGIANGGVCWWHSRFQRNATYLTIYKPSEKKPSKEQAKNIITKIKLAKEVVIIPGFRNFSEFTSTYQSEIQSELNKWQKLDGVVKFN